MKFDRPLIPEIVLGKRGSPTVTRMYRELLRDVRPEVVEGKMGVTVPKSLLSMIDSNALEHILVARVFREKGGKAFYLTNDFAAALSKLDREIPVAHLPTNFVGYFILGQNALSDESGPVDGGFVYIGPARDLGMRNEDGTPKTETVLSINYFNKSERDGAVGEVYRFSYAINDLASTKLGDFLKENADSATDSIVTTRGLEKKMSKPDDLAARAPVVRALINAVLYAHSDDPEVCNLVPLSSYSNKKRAEFKKTLPAQNFCTIPITLLNRSYKEGLTYSVGSTVVQAHLRWQRCGAGLSKIKLVWVKEHERKYVIP